MTTKAYLVSWLGQGNIIWTPLEQTAQGGLSLNLMPDGPLKYALNLAASKSDIAATMEQILNPTMAGIRTLQASVDIATNLAICAVGLQLVSLAQTYRLMHKVEEVDRKVSEISGKFELHFLEKSLDFMLASHKDAYGLIAPVAAALEEDCYNALQAIVDCVELKIPAYLRVKLISLAQSIESWNQLMYSVIHGGTLQRVSDDRLRKWVQETDPTTKALPHGGYASQADILKVWEENLSNTEKGSRWISEIFSRRDQRPLLARALAKENFKRSYPILLLAREIQTSLSFSEALEEKIKGNDDLPLLITTAA